MKSVLHHYRRDRASTDLGEKIVQFTDMGVDSCQRLVYFLRKMPRLQYQILHSLVGEMSNAFSG
jgi:hypothetical protein